MNQAVLSQVLRFIEENPQSAEALTLYALVSTLEYDGAGCLFQLNKLTLLAPERRRLAYELMELMTIGAPQGDEWKKAKTRMDTAIRNG